MKKTALHTKDILIGLLIFVLLLPSLQKFSGMTEPEPLKGVVIEKERPVFSPEGFFSGDYQQQSMDYIEDHIGLRPYLVRLYNQVRFSWFHSSGSEEVVLAKDGLTLMTPGYIDSYYGRSFIGADTIAQRVHLLEALQAELQKKNKHLLLVLSPGKASFYPELIPPYFRKASTLSNYDGYTAAFKNTSLHVLDFKKWFIDQKDTVSRALFPPYGAHWTKYGASLAADSLRSYMEHLSGKKMAARTLKRFDRSNGLNGQDYDLGDLLNLYTVLPAAELYNPKLEYQKSKTDDHPNVLVIGDSYWWNLRETRMPDEQWGEYRFLYYFKTCYDQRHGLVKKLEEINLQEEISRADFIIIMSTEANDHIFPFGFPEKALEKSKP